MTLCGPLVIRITMVLTRVGVESKMVTFINMVTTRVKNRSPDMILTNFDRKLNEKKDEIPPGACRPPNTSKYSILGI